MAIENPLAQIEEELIAAVAKTQELYNMVFHIKNSSSLKEFFLNLSLNNETATRVCEKMGTVQIFVKTNTEINTEKKNQPTKPD